MSKDEQPSIASQSASHSDRVTQSAFDVAAYSGS
jgi:hypothetical protein